MPGWREAAVRIALKAHPWRNAVVCEQAMTGLPRLIAPARGPAAAIENEHAPRRTDGAVNETGLLAGRRLAQLAAVRSRDNGRRPIGLGEFVEHPYRVHHDRRTRAPQLRWNVGMETLRRVAGPHDARIQARENELAPHRRLEQRKDPRMVDASKVEGIVRRQVGDVTGPAVEDEIFAMAFEQPLIGGAELANFVGGQDIADQREAVSLDLEKQL